MDQQIEPDHQEQLEEDTVQPVIQPDHQEQPEESTAINWMRNIWRRIAGNR